jgi:hypothetical protein
VPGADGAAAAQARLAHVWASRGVCVCGRAGAAGLAWWAEVERERERERLGAEGRVDGRVEGKMGCCGCLFVVWFTCGFGEVGGEEECPLSLGPSPPFLYHNELVHERREEGGEGEVRTGLEELVFRHFF